MAAGADVLVPREQIEALAAQVSGPSTLVNLPADSGHDAFLIEPDAMSEILSAALSTSDFTPSAVA